MLIDSWSQHAHCSNVELKKNGIYFCDSLDHCRLCTFEKNWKHVPTDRYFGTQIIILGNVATPGRQDRPPLVIKSQLVNSLAITQQVLHPPYYVTRFKYAAKVSLCSHVGYTAHAETPCGNLIPKISYQNPVPKPRSIAPTLWILHGPQTTHYLTAIQHPAPSSPASPAMISNIPQHPLLYPPYRTISEWIKST